MELSIESKKVLRIPSIKQWLFVLSFVFFLQWSHQWLEQILNQQMWQAMQSESTHFLITASALFSSGLLFAWLEAVGILILLTVFSNSSPEYSIYTRMGDFTREWIRSVGNASLWMFLGIIPGLLRWVDYSFLPFICFFDPEYQNGKIDALKQCSIFAKGIRLKLWSLWIGLGILQPLLFSSFFNQFESLFDYPIQGSLLVLGDSAFQILSLVCLWYLFIRRSHQVSGTGTTDSN